MKLGVTTPRFIPFHPIGPNEATVNNAPEYVPIATTRLLDVGTSPHVHLMQPWEP